MRKWLIILVIVVLAVGGGMLWLAGQASKGKPPAGEVRLEIENVF